MYKYTILLVICWLYQDILYSQHFINFDDQIGLSQADSMELLEEASSELNNTMPVDYVDSFKVFSMGVYLHTNTFDSDLSNAWSIYLDSIDHTTKYYLAFMLISSPTELYRTIDFRIKLPPLFSFSDCFDDQSLQTINSLISNKILELSQYKPIKFEHIEIEVIKSIEAKLLHVTYCCNLTNVRSGETCPGCYREMDDVATILEDDGFFNLNIALSTLLSADLTVTVSPKNYNNINSDYQIVFSNAMKGINYNFTDALEYYVINYGTNINYSLDVFVYDDDINTEDIECFETLPESRSRTDYDLSEFLAIVKYGSKSNIYIKLTPTNPIDLLIKLPVYLFNATGFANSSTAISNDIMTPIMSDAFSDANDIYFKNYFDILDYHLLETKEEFDAYVPNGRNMLYCFRNTLKNHGQAFARGLTTPVSGLTAILEKGPNEGGCYVDLDGSEYKTKPYSLGYALAHEILHALILRGAYVIGVPMNDLIQYGLLTKEKHWDITKDHPWPRNLNASAAQTGEIPIPVDNELNPKETILAPQRYFILKYIYSNVQ